MTEFPLEHATKNKQERKSLFAVSIHDEAEPLCDENYETTDVTRVPFYERLSDVFENPGFCKFKIIIDTTEITVKKF